MSAYQCDVGRFKLDPFANKFCTFVHVNNEDLAFLGDGRTENHPQSHPSPVWRPLERKNETEEQRKGAKIKQIKIKSH